ncbi:MAG: Smr/MutS family protein [Candidatus Eisenbacteria bacterium]
MDQRTLRLLEFDRVATAIAAHAESATAAERLRVWAPLADAAERSRENERLAAAIARVTEPGEWCFVAPGSLAGPLSGGERAVLDGPALVAVGLWLEAAERTVDAWRDDEQRVRFAPLVEVVDALAPPPSLAARLAASLEPDGRVRDGASPTLARLRRELGAAERRLEQRLEVWARGFGPDSYVTRHGDRFVALVPAAGFPRRRAIVHDVSGSGASLFVEPFEMCEDNNRLMEMRGAAADEERRVLQELRGVVLASRDALLMTEDALVRLDALRARARWARRVGARAIAPGGDRLTLEHARHPLLAERAAVDPSFEVVPLTLVLGGAGGARVLLVSGPNMGGKTVLLKTVGLAALAAHSGFPVVAGEGSALPELEQVHVDLGDEQSLDQGLSTFAAHLEVLARMAAAAGPRTLLLCDELGAGTDPDEGGALARALLEHVTARGAWAVTTTHLGSLKRVAGEVGGIANGSLEFDPDTLQSRYRFVMGVPGASHALSVAERLGFPAELLARARHLTPESARTLERLTTELAEATRTARENAEALERARAEADAAATEHRAATEHARRELAERRRALTRETDALLARARELWQTVQREARRSEKTRVDAEQLRVSIRKLESDAERVAGAHEPGEEPVTLPREAVVPGRRVRVADLGVEAVVVAGPDPEGRVQLRRGSWNIQSHVSKLAEAAPGERVQAVAGTWTASEEAPAAEVDLRGMDADEALRTLDEGLDRAVVAGLGELRVIHGIGRGVLRAAVDRHLRAHPQVAGRAVADQNQGGRGVTVVRLR